MSDEKETTGCTESYRDIKYWRIFCKDSDNVWEQYKDRLYNGISWKNHIYRSLMNNSNRLLTSLSALKRFTNDALRLKYDPGYLNGFHFNSDLLKAAVVSTYLETAKCRADSIHLAIEWYHVHETGKEIMDSLFSRISALSRKSMSENTDP